MQWRFLITAGLTLVLGMPNGVAIARAAGQFSGLASFYDKNFKGQTASGTPYDGSKFTAAHRTLPFGTRLSYAAALALRMTDRGVVNVVASVD